MTIHSQLYASDLFGRRYFLVVCSLCGVVGTVVASRSHSFGVGLFGFCLGAVGLACIPAGYAIPSEVLRTFLLCLLPVTKQGTAEE